MLCTFNDAMGAAIDTYTQEPDMLCTFNQSHACDGSRNRTRTPKSLTCYARSTNHMHAMGAAIEHVHPRACCVCCYREIWEAAVGEILQVHRSDEANGHLTYILGEISQKRTLCCCHSLVTSALPFLIGLCYSCVSCRCASTPLGSGSLCLLASRSTRDITFISHSTCTCSCTTPVYYICVGTCVHAAYKISIGLFICC